MKITGIKKLDKSWNKTFEWIKELQKELGIKEEKEAFLILKAVLHSIRDRLSISEVIHLGAQLPLFLLGVYYEGWKPSKSDNPKNQNFISSVAQQLPKRTNMNPVILATFKSLEKRIHFKEVQEIRKNLQLAI